jgi:hypothetical protein
MTEEEEILEGLIIKFNNSQKEVAELKAKLVLRDKTIDELNKKLDSR